MPRADTLGYRDIKDIVLKRIRSRVWPPGSVLPNEEDLAREFSCTRTTVNRAMRELADEGFLERKRKAGTRVLPAPTRLARFSIPLVRDEVERAGAVYRYALIDQTTLPAPDWLRTRIRLSSGTEVVHVRALHYADAKPFQFEDRWINTATVPGVRDADFSALGPNEWLVQQVPFTDMDVAFSAITLDQAAAEFLGADTGAAAFQAERITWLESAAVTFVKLTFAPGYRMTTSP